MHSESQRHRYIDFDDLLISTSTTEHDWYIQTEKDSFIYIRKIYEKLGGTAHLLLSQFHSITDCDAISYFFNVSKRVVFEQTSSGILPFNMIAELGSSNIITESVNNKVTKFIQRYVYRGTEMEGIFETRMRKYNEIKTKTTHSILIDPNSLTRYIN